MNKYCAIFFLCTAMSFLSAQKQKNIDSGENNKDMGTNEKSKKEQDSKRGEYLVFRLAPVFILQPNIRSNWVFTGGIGYNPIWKSAFMHKSLRIAANFGVSLPPLKRRKKPFGIITLNGGLQWKLYQYALEGKGGIQIWTDSVAPSGFPPRIFLNAELTTLYYFKKDFYYISHVFLQYNIVFLLGKLTHQLHAGLGFSFL